MLFASVGTRKTDNGGFYHHLGGRNCGAAFDLLAGLDCRVSVRRADVSREVARELKKAVDGKHGGLSAKLREMNGPVAVAACGLPRNQAMLPECLDDVCHRGSAYLSMPSEVGRRGRQWIERIKGKQGDAAGPRMVLKAEPVMQLATQCAADGAAGGENGQYDHAAIGVADPGLPGYTQQKPQRMPGDVAVPTRIARPCGRVGGGVL